MSDADETTTLRRVDALIETLPAASEPYWVAVEVMGAASDALVTSRTACRHYRMWAALTDWYELKPEDRSDAVGTMQRAATEWLAVKDSAVAQTRYFDKWLHDVLGHERE